MFRRGIVVGCSDLYFFVTVVNVATYIEVCSYYTQAASFQQAKNARLQELYGKLCLYLLIRSLCTSPPRVPPFHIILAPAT